jgi:hypothetical protein
MAGVAPKRKVFLGNHFVHPNNKYQLKNKYPPLAKNVTNGYRSVVTHVLYYFCDISLIAACAIFCSLKFHVVCTCTFFGDTICRLTNRKMTKIVTLIDSHIVLTYDWWHCFLVFNIWVSRTLEMTIKFITQPLSCFVFHLPNLLLLHLHKILFTQPFSLRHYPPP